MQQTKFEAFLDALDIIFLITGWIFLLLGMFGIMMVALTYPRNIFKDETLSFASMFIYSCMTIFGILLIKFHGKILVKPKPYY